MKDITEPIGKNEKDRFEYGILYNSTVSKC